MMQILSAFHFVRPLWLLMLVPAVALFLLQHYRSDAADRWRKVIDPDLLKYLLVGGEGRSRVTPNGLLLVAWMLAIVAVAGPTWQYEPSPFADAKPPVMVVAKVTPSMTASDLAPSRLNRGRQKLSDLLATREGAAAGLIAYAGSAHLVLPPTADRDVVLTMAGALSPAIMPQDGDSLADGLIMADDILSAGQRGGSIVVLADTVAGEQIAELSTRKTKHPVVFLALVPPQQDSGSLDDAARAAGGSVIPTTIDQTDISALGDHIDRLERINAVAGEGSSWRESGYWLVPVLVLLVLSWFRRGWVLA